MDKYTFGSSQAAVNLIDSILKMPEYQQYSKRVARAIDKQFKIMGYVSTIPDKPTRELTLVMWHNRFIDSINDLPEIIRTHILCVAKTRYKRILREGGKNERIY